MTFSFAAIEPHFQGLPDADKVLDCFLVPANGQTRIYAALPGYGSFVFAVIEEDYIEDPTTLGIVAKFIASAVSDTAIHLKHKGAIIQVMPTEEL